MSGPQCCENPPNLSSTCGVGSVTEIGGLKAYVTGPSDSKLAILLVSDIYAVATSFKDKGFEDAKLVIAALRNKGVSTIGAAGFCWGGKVVADLSKSECIQAAVLLHPSRVTVDDIKEVKAPIAILGAEFDEKAPPELLKQFEEVLSSKPEVSGYVKIYPGASHGWTVMYKDEDETAVKLAEEAHQDMLDWLTQYVQ
ncbi:hypothetical protein M0R45_010903 [Rubus argutus]|uniref:Dienelactone hydrolase domain-containing protein n=1 Tax=Rubus argutus TaxID=59490 RepID=A0AAW1Y8F5_RUBAR